MKFLFAFAALVAVAVASPLGVNKPATNELAELEAIVAAIQSPNTDAATVALLEEQLAAIISVISPIAVGPAIVEEIAPEPIIAVNPVVVEPTPVEPSPVVIGEIPEGATPLVQIIVNVNGAESVAPAPIEELVPSPVNVVENVIEPEPIIAINPVVPVPEPVIIVNPVIVAPLPEPISVVEEVVVEPVQVVEPIIPGPAIVPVEAVQVVAPIIN